MVEPEIHPDPEQPRSKPPRCVEPIEPVVNFPERFLSQVAGEFLVTHQPGEHADELPLVTAHQGGKRAIIARSCALDKSNVAEFTRGRRERG
jgi:hypothetical protein